MSRHALSIIAVLVIGSCTCHGQMIHTEVPFTSINSDYFESSGVRWSLRGPNWFANFGGQGPLLPPFGSADPGAGLRGGFGFSNGGVSGSLGFHFAQGSSRSITSTTPSLTTMDGYPGSISAGVVRPFVIGFTPVVGDFSGAVAPLNAANQAGDQMRQQQLMSLRQSQAVLQNKRLDQYLRRAARAESDGNKRMARANYRSAIAIAPEPLRSQLRQRLQWVMQQP